ncbi:AP complex, mu/sigma subunit [Cynara cardunculus var. scolymus]|uniref:Coatomer subunit zeta n=1 Tax=Cynara cardunculus var. scolymus TaxID=59895 RepID=A0A103XW54_CYNCS|nr:AP complex, mu/sigma subunit [Cynara cardunculus var. scolymus]
MEKIARRDASPTIKNVLLLDSEGRRMAVKYYTDEWTTNGAKLAFEKSIFSKTQKTNARTEAEIVMFENNVVVYKFIQDLHFFVTGGDDENELALATVLQGFFDAVTLLLRLMNNFCIVSELDVPDIQYLPCNCPTFSSSGFRGNVDQREALQNLDMMFLCLDEIVDGGMILETDGNMIAGKVATHSMDDGAPLSEQTITQALATAREHLTRSLLR